MEIKNLPEKYQKLWDKCLPILQQGRPGDDTHAVEVAEFVINCGNKDIDLDILTPVAIMHDIGHSAILPEHFKYITGGERVANGKLVHMLAGAKIAKDLLESIEYDKNKIEEIIDIISMHDSDQLEGTDVSRVYNTQNKRIFHDIDCMDRYNLERLRKMEKSFPDKNKMWSMLEKGLETFFDPQFKEIARKKLEEMKNNY
ncbi:MAG: HD domain-containing protein [Candidatus Buchananbacteria bacterium]